MVSFKNLSALCSPVLAFGCYYEYSPSRHMEHTQSVPGTILRLTRQCALLFLPNQGCFLPSLYVNSLFRYFRFYSMYSSIRCSSVRQSASSIWCSSSSWSSLNLNKVAKLKGNRRNSREIRVVVTMIIVVTNIIVVSNVTSKLYFFCKSFCEMSIIMAFRF